MQRRRALVILSVVLGSITGMPQSQKAPPATRPVIRGTHYAIASMKPEATQAADRILQAGGNAFDAAVAGQAVLGITDAANNGVGSDAVLLIYDARSKDVFSLNAEGTSPRLATIEWYTKNQGGKIPVDDGLLSATVPGVVDAWFTLLDRWGTKSFAEVLQPAIEIAENGYSVSDRTARLYAETSKLRKYPSSVSLFKLDSAVYRGGAIIRNPDLTRTLRKLVEAEKDNLPRGRHEALKAARDRFYKGDIAREMARFAEQNGGLFRYEDFAAYTVEVEKPVSIDYRGYQVYKNPSASQGPAELFTLRLLEGYDLKAMGHNSAEFIHTCAEAVKLAFADRDQFLGDMDFIKIPYDGLLSKEYARDRRALIDPSKASLEFRPGNPEKYMSGFEPVKRPIDLELKGDAQHDGDTSYIAVVDGQRNMVSFTPSLHSSFGTGVVMGNLGFILNCRGDYYSLVPGHANALEPGKRPRSTLQSTLLMKDGKPLGILGSPGGDDQCMRTMQTFLNVVEFGMNVQQAIEAPRWASQSFPASPFPHTMYPGAMSIEERVPKAVLDALEAKGHKLKVTSGWSLGSNAAILIDPETGALSAGADPRCDAYALAW